VLAHGIHDYLTRLARTVKDAVADEVPDAGSQPADGGAADGGTADGESAPPAPVDERTMDQLRADILADLVLTGLPTTAAIDARGGEGLDAIRAIVQVTVPAATLMSDDAGDRESGGVPATLAGRCPIDPGTARRLAGSANMWSRVFTDPCTAEVLAVDRRFPTQAQVRFLRARDEHCRFPGCRMPVWRSDIDHTIDHQDGGQTTPCNLEHLCRRHHVLKHQTEWTVEQRPGGVLVWTSPLGRVYTDRPPPTLRFVPSLPEPAPSDWCTTPDG